MDEANDERLVVVIKNEQQAIQKDDIDRIDFRPATKSKIAKETRTSQTDSTQTSSVGPQPRGSQPGPSTSTTTSISGAPKPDFETIYRRTAK
jgi:cell division protein FtsN